jgi:hypothetical protein
MTQQATVSGTTGVQVFQPQALNPLIIYEQPFVPIQIVQIYINLAVASLPQQLYFEYWKVACGYFVAHFVTLWLQAMGSPASSAGQVAAAGLQSGILTSKSVGGVSAGYTNIVPQEFLAFYGPTWATTRWGVLLMSLASTITPRFVYIY